MPLDPVKRRARERRYYWKHHDERLETKKNWRKKNKKSWQNSNKRYRDVHGDDRLTFMQRRIHTRKILRTGKCSKCGFVGKTNMDHLWYDPLNPTAGVIEVCDSCHHLRHWFVRKLSKLVIPDLTA